MAGVSLLVPQRDCVYEPIGSYTPPRRNSRFPAPLPVPIRHCLSQWPDLNRRPTPYHGVALPAELHWQLLQNTIYATGKQVSPTPFPFKSKRLLNLCLSHLSGVEHRSRATLLALWNQSVPKPPQRENFRFPDPFPFQIRSCLTS